MLILVFFLIYLYSYFFDKIEKIEIFPFDSIDNSELDGNAFSNGITAELNRIHDILVQGIKQSEAERLPIPHQESLTPMLSDGEEIIKNLSTDIATKIKDISDIGKMTMGGLELPIGSITSAIFRNRKIGNGVAIKGNLYKDGNDLYSIAQIAISKNNWTGVEVNENRRYQKQKVHSGGNLESQFKGIKRYQVHRTARYFSDLIKESYN
jgi:hypothetical protein